MKKLSFLLLVNLLFLITACSSNKQNTQNAKERNQNRQGPPSIEEMFKMDTNADGFLSKSEVKGRLLKDFSKIDTNSDGLLSREEVEQAPKPKRRPRN